MKSEFIKKHKVLLISISFAIKFGLSAYYFFLSSNILEDKNIDITHVNTDCAIISDIDKQKCLKNMFTFKVVSYLFMRKDRIKEGSYALSKGMNNWEILKLLQK